jgi:hypothetical protein
MHILSTRSPWVFTLGDYFFTLVQPCRGSVPAND